MRLHHASSEVWMIRIRLLTFLVVLVVAGFVSFEGVQLQRIVQSNNGLTKAAVETAVTNQRILKDLENELAGQQTAAAKAVQDKIISDLVKRINAETQASSLKNRQILEHIAAKLGITP